jgi:hypothetical protein
MIGKRKKLSIQFKKIKMIKDNKIRYEFLIFNEDTTLILENPLSIVFINEGIDPVAPFGNVTINRNLILIPRWRAIASSQSPPLNLTDYFADYKLELYNQPNQVDSTQYTIQFKGGSSALNRLVVICKYRTI